MPSRPLPTLAALAVALTLQACGVGPATAPSPAAPTTGDGAPDAPASTDGGVLAYGDHPSQVVQLDLPAGTGTPAPTVVLLHGGFWLDGYGRDLMDELAADVVARGWVAANVEYRRVGDGGGYPATLADVAAALDLVASRPEVDPERVAVVGHSAGGHLALWAAARTVLPDGVVGASPLLRPCGVVGQAPVADLAAAARSGLGGGAVAGLLGGQPDDVPDAYAVADPARHLGHGVPVLLVHAADDRIVPLGQSTSFVDRHRAAGGVADVEVVEGGHFVVLDATAAPWAATVDWLAGACSFEPT